MSYVLPERHQTARRYLAYLALVDAHRDFILSCQAMQCSPTTLTSYRFTVGLFLDRMKDRGVSGPHGITARPVHEHMPELVGTGKSDTTMHDHRRAIKTLLRFWYAEGYLPAPMVFIIPKVRKKRLPAVSAEQLR